MWGYEKMPNRILSKEEIVEIADQSDMTPFDAAYRLYELTKQALILLEEEKAG